jgi:polar amino acid transport system substrate-binding protein
MSYKCIQKFWPVFGLCFLFIAATDAAETEPRPTPVVATQAYAKQGLTIYTEHFPPYNFASDDKLTGINLELVRTMCELNDISCEFNLYPWNRAFRMAEETPSSGLVSAAKTQERETLFKWVGPLVSGQHCIYKLSSRTDITVDDMSSLAKYSIAATRDNSHTTMLESLGLKADKNLRWFARKYSELKPFAAGRVDLIVGSAITIEAQVKHAELELSDIAPVFVIPLPPHNGNYLALNINTSDELVDNLQASLDKIRSQGALELVEAQFVKPVPAQKANIKSQDLWNTCVKRFE